MFEVGTHSSEPSFFVHKIMPTLHSLHSVDKSILLPLLTGLRHESKHRSET